MDTVHCGGSLTLAAFSHLYSIPCAVAIHHTSLPSTACYYTIQTLWIVYALLSVRIVWLHNNLKEYMQIQVRVGGEGE